MIDLSLSVGNSFNRDAKLHSSFTDETASLKNKPMVLNHAL